MTGNAIVQLHVGWRMPETIAAVDVGIHRSTAPWLDDFNPLVFPAGADDRHAFNAGMQVCQLGQKEIDGLRGRDELFTGFCGRSYVAIFG